MTAPGLAHEVVNQALALTGRSVEWGKSKPGMFKSVIERVEGPVNATLSSGPARSVIKVGDRVLTTVDKSIESAMNTSTYKSGEAFVRNQYSNRIVPATNTVTTTVVTTTSRVTTPVVNTYMGVLKFADKQVRSIIMLCLLKKVPCHPAKCFPGIAHAATSCLCSFPSSTLLVWRAEQLSLSRREQMCAI